MIKILFLCGFEVHLFLFFTAAVSLTNLESERLLILLGGYLVVRNN
jgi:hypothetical protein